MTDLKVLGQAELIRLLQQSQAGLRADRDRQERLLHDLETHQIELELQNRELGARELPMQVAVATNSEVRDAELHVQLPSGRRTVMLGSAAPLRDAHGAVRGAIGAFMDITERQRAQEALRTFSRVIEQTASTVVITDARGVIEYVNPRFTATAGYSAQEAIGQRPSILKSGHTPQEGYQRLWETITAGTTWQGEFLNRRKDGTTYWESATISPVHDAAGRITHFVGIKDDVTEHKRAEAALRDQEARYRAVVETAADGFLMLDRKGRILAMNDAYLRRSGYRRTELLGLRIADLEARESPEEVRAHVERLIRDGSDRFETRHRTKSGRTWPAEVNASFSPIDGGLFFAFVHDITERQRTERALREAVASQDAVLAALPDLMCELDADGRFLAVWAQHDGELPLPKERLPGRTISELLPAAAAEQVMAALREADALGQSMGQQIELATPEGTAWFELSTALKDASTSPHRFIVLLRNVSERRRMETALLESETRYRNLFLHAPDAILVNREDRVTLVNEACLRLFGARVPRELIGKTPYDLVPAEFHPQLHERIRRLRASDQAGHPHEERILRLDGSTVDVEVIAAPLPQEGDDARHVILRDITERKALEREIIAVSSAEQQRIGQEIHDGLGQQLTGMTMLAGGIERRLAAAGHPAEAAAVAELHAYLQATLEEARVLARGLVPVEIDAEGLPDVLADLGERVRNTTGIECRCLGTLTARVPDSDVARHLYRIAQEAIQNAVKHADPSRIDVNLEHVDRRLVLSIRDDGRGIDLAAERRGGQLGLRIMRYRAGIIGAELRIAPIEGGGTEVHCELPLRA